MICEANNQHMLVKVHCRQVHLIVAHFYPPPPTSTKKKNHHDLHVSARMHPKNSLKFCLVIQKCWQVVHLCDLFFCGFYNQFQQRQRSGRNKICRKLLSSFQEANKGLYFISLQARCLPYLFLFLKFEVSELPVCLSEFHLHIMTYQKWLVKLWIILFKQQFV